MAQFSIAFNWIMDFEDPERACQPVPDAPPGAHAISGINSYSFPTAFERIAALPESERLTEVAKFYQGYFWDAGWFTQLESDELAKRVFDAAVNMGSSVVVKLLQRSLLIEDDGIWGPETIECANKEPITISVFQAERRQYYLNIVQHNPDDAKYLSGWLVRAQK